MKNSLFMGWADVSALSPRFLAKAFSLLAFLMLVIPMGVGIPPWAPWGMLSVFALAFVVCIAAVLVSNPGGVRPPAPGLDRVDERMESYIKTLQSPSCDAVPLRGRGVILVIVFVASLAWGAWNVWVNQGLASPHETIPGWVRTMLGVLLPLAQAAAFTIVSMNLIYLERAKECAVLAKRVVQEKLLVPPAKLDLWVSADPADGTLSANLPNGGVARIWIQTGANCLHPMFMGEMSLPSCKDGEVVMKTVSMHMEGCWSWRDAQRGMELAYTMIVLGQVRHHA